MVQQLPTMPVRFACNVEQRSGSAMSAIVVGLVSLEGAAAQLVLVHALLLS